MSSRRVGIWVAGAVIATLAVVLPALAAGRSPAATAVTAKAEATRPVQVVILNSGFRLSTKVATVGALQFRMVNRSPRPCAFRFGTKTSPVLAPRKSAILRVTITRPGAYKYMCTQRPRVAGTFDVAPSVSTTVTVDMTDFAFGLSQETVRWGTSSFRLASNGSVGHDMQIAGRKSAVLSAGQTGVLEVIFPRPGRYPYVCTVPGHAAAGMKGVLEVTRS